MDETGTPDIPRRERLRRVAAAGTDYGDLRGRHITPNQLVAYNMAYWRKVAGLKQEELAERLNRAVAGKSDWTNATISAAERSWDGKRIRQFDADTIFALASTLYLPVSAFFLPPEDDGVEQRYLIDLPHPVPVLPNENRCYQMDEIMELGVLSDPYEFPDDDEGDDGAEPDPDYIMGRTVNERYSERGRTAISFYFGAEEAADAGGNYGHDAWGLADVRDEQVDKDLIFEKLERARHHYESLRQLMGDISQVQRALYVRLGELPEERLSQGEAEEVVSRYRNGESIDDIAATIKKDPFLVEKALVAAKEGYLAYSREVQGYIFQKSSETPPRAGEQQAGARSVPPTGESR